MIVSAYISQIFQTLLGENYIVQPFFTFQGKHYQNLETPMGTKYDINYQTFAEYGNKTVSTVQTPSDTMVNTVYDYSGGTYEVFFWVPLDNKDEPIYDNAGNIINPPDYNFFDDIDKLRGELKNKWIDLSADRLATKALLTVSQPNLISSAIEESGQFQRVCVRLSGQFNFLDSNVETGAQIDIAFRVDGEWYSFENPIGMQIGASTDSNILQYTDIEATETEVAAIGQQVAFTVDAYNPNGTNKALTVVKKKIYELDPILTPSAPLEKQKRKVYTRITDGEFTSEFWGILSAELTSDGNTAVNRYKVAIVNSAERDLDEGGG